MVITGSGFGDGATVTFGGVAATSVVVVDQTTITCLTPAHAVGLVDVTVTNPDAQSGTLTDGFRYACQVWADTPITHDTTPPVGTDIAPGSHLMSSCSSPGDDWRDVGDLGPPVPIFLTESNGPVAGGVKTFVYGTNFIRGVTATLGGNSATVTYINAFSISIITPAHVLGLVDLTLHNPDLQNGTLVGAYLYDPLPPVVLKLIPAVGSTAGGDTVIVDGENFQSGATVSFGNLLAAVTFVNSNTLSCVTPEHTEGTFDVRVVNPL